MASLGDEDVKKLLDYFVYAPIGVISSLADSIPKAVENGRQVVESRGMAAKFMGKMAVDFAGSAIKSQLDEAKENVGERVVSVLPEPWSDLARFVLGIEDKTPAGNPSNPNPTNTDTTTNDVKIEADVIVVVEDPVLKDIGSPAENQVAGIEEIIPSYGTLSANQIVSKLDRLKGEELRAVLEFETSHRGRKTIIGRVTDLLVRTE